MSAGSVGDRIRVADALVVDGTGSAPYPAHILLDGGRIAAIERDAATAQAWDAAVVDAGGQVVCPGFIDVHSHADNAPFLGTDDLTKIAQGVTTEVTGNCGLSMAPLDGPHAADAREAMFEHFPLRDGAWSSTEQLFAAIDELGSVTNLCPLIGHSTLRTAVMGRQARRPTAEDTGRMADLLGEAVAAGAFGLSSGLIYPPGLYANTEELAALAAVLPDGRVYATHMRNESDLLMESIEESLRTVQGARCRLQVSHLKSSGRTNFGGVERALERLDEARAQGVPVAQDVYPYDAASTFLSACLPPWAHDGGAAATLERLQDPATLERLRSEIETDEPCGWENLIQGADGYQGILVVSTGSGRFAGRTLQQLAADLDVEPFDAFVHVLVSEHLNAQMVEFCMSENDVETVLRSPYTAVGSDGLSPGRAGCPHPRLYGTYPRVLSRFVRERRVLDLAEAIRRMTSLPAELFSIPERGTVAVGMVADLVCFDPARIAHNGDFLNPSVPPEGIDWVMMAGRAVMTGGAWHGTRRGRRLEPA